MNLSQRDNRWWRDDVLGHYLPRCGQSRVSALPPTAERLATTASRLRGGLAVIWGLRVAATMTARSYFFGENKLSSRFSIFIHLIGLDRSIKDEQLHFVLSQIFVDILQAVRYYFTHS